MGQYRPNPRQNRTWRGGFLAPERGETQVIPRSNPALLLSRRDQYSPITRPSYRLAKRPSVTGLMPGCPLAESDPHPTVW